MSMPREHDYIGSSEPLPVEKCSDKILSSSSSSTVSSVNEEKIVLNLNLKETELRLGLPGSESTERKSVNGVSLFGKDLKDEICNGIFQSPLKNFVSDSKRGFSDAINGSGKWALSINGGSEVDLRKSSVLFSPRGVNGSPKSGNTLQSCFPGSSVKEVGDKPPMKSVEDKKNEHGSSAPASKDKWEMGILDLGELVHNISQEVLLLEHMKHLHLDLVGQILKMAITMMLEHLEIMVNAPSPYLRSNPWWGATIDTKFSIFTWDSWWATYDTR